MECGAEDACDGKSQDWKATPIPGKAETYMFASAASSAFCINAVSDPSGERARRHWRDVSEPVDPSPCTWGVERRGEISPLGSLAGCFLALGSGLGLVGTPSSRR